MRVFGIGQESEAAGHALFDFADGSDDAVGVSNNLCLKDSGDLCNFEFHRTKFFAKIHDSAELTASKTGKISVFQQDHEKSNSKHSTPIKKRRQLFPFPLKPHRHPTHFYLELSNKTVPPSSPRRLDGADNYIVPIKFSKNENPATSIRKNVVLLPAEK
jgi:hypothetical protein